MTGKEIVYFSLLFGVFFALLSASPKRKLGQHDDKINSRERGAYFTYSIFIGLCGSLSTMFLFHSNHEAPAIILMIILIPLFAFLQAAYYTFLVLENIDENDKGKENDIHL